MIYVIPDIHGRFDLLEKALDWVMPKMSNETKLVFLGDYVDRGPDSAKVVKRVREIQSQSGYNIICLLGNHEQMMMEEMAGWDYNGGDATLKSYENLYGFEWWRERFFDDQKWMKTLPYYHESGKYIFVHANADPTIPLDQQSMTMLWDRHYSNNPFPGKIVVHGHTPVNGWDVREGRINLDGGAVFYGKLNVAVLKPDGIDAIKVFQND